MPRIPAVEGCMSQRRIRTPSPAEVTLIAGLPNDHRKHLVDKCKIPKKAVAVEEQARYIAERVPTEALRAYGTLYLDGIGGSFACYRFEGDIASASAAVSALVKKRPALHTINGVRRHLRPDAPPLMHRILRYNGYDVLEYVAKDGVSRRFHNYGRAPQPVEHLYRVVLRKEPFSVEIRAGSAPKQKRLLKAVQDDLGIDFGIDIPCRIIGEVNADGLAKSMDARFVKVTFRTTGGGARSVVIDADETSGIETTERYKNEISIGSKETARGYEYQTFHPEDEYMETATFDVTLKNGQMRMAANTSERAIERLRQHVVARFAPATPEPNDAEAS